VLKTWRFILLLADLDMLHNVIVVTVAVVTAAVTFAVTFAVTVIVTVIAVVTVTVVTCWYLWRICRFFECG